VDARHVVNVGVSGRGMISIETCWSVFGYCDDGPMCVVHVFVTGGL
jgi:hypothetical protein